MIDTALIRLPSRAEDLIFGRPLLERLLIVCRRVGIQRFIVEVPQAARESVGTALQAFGGGERVEVVDSLAGVLGGLDPEVPCLLVSGNLVIAKAQLQRALTQYADNGAHGLQIITADTEHGGSLKIGRPRQLLSALGGGPHKDIQTLVARGDLPFALNGRPEDRSEAEVRLAHAVRDESRETDALMARIFDRKLSWRLSLWLARFGVAPNAVTLANTALGLFSAFLMAGTSYWVRLVAALLFLVCITIDGVDGELARLRMVESDFGGKLDVLTDNLVHIAVFVGLMVGCYRTSHDNTYVYLCIALLVGFACCAVAVEYALRAGSELGTEWVGRVERATGRDFAYVIVVLALIDRLRWFAWGTAAGTYVFALVLWLLTRRHRPRAMVKSDDGFANLAVSSKEGILGDGEKA
ncbi:MAG TPA: CDP-alcohol phosphatidyltransferase family protein [Candidatus Binataceae bacterium]|nr:CDP-alcohol phosphatidyltransferase family protein [Candidatus Binataceae bacterium]